MGTTLEMDKGIDLTQQGHNNAVEKDFGAKWLGLGDHWDPDCIQAQLKAFYKDLGCEPTVKDKVGGTDDQKVDVP